MKALKNQKVIRKRNLRGQEGRIGYLVLYLLGAPVGLLILLWVILGNNLFGAG
jgi:hypothetical protein